MADFRNPLDHRHPPIDSHHPSAVWLDVFGAAPFRLGGTAQPDVYTYVGRVCLIPAASRARSRGGNILHAADLHYPLRGAFHWRQDWPDRLGLDSSGVSWVWRDP